MIHQYINNGYYIVLDVSSGSVHVTDEVLYDAIAIAEPLIGEIESPITLSNEIKNKIENELVKKGHNIEDIKECMEDMQELINMEELFTKDTYETYVRDFKSRKYRKCYT